MILYSMINKYQLKPIYSFFKKKVIYPDGIPDRTLKCANSLGLISDKRVELLLAIKYKKEYEIDKEELEYLEKKGFIKKRK